MESTATAESLKQFRQDIMDSIIDVKNTIHNVSEKVDDVKDDVAEIRIQTTKTNGRVISLESFRAGFWKVMLIFLTGAVTGLAGCFVYYVTTHFKK